MVYLIMARVIDGVLGLLVEGQRHGLWSGGQEMWPLALSLMQTMNSAGSLRGKLSRVSCSSLAIHGEFIGRPSPARPIWLL